MKLLIIFSLVMSLCFPAVADTADELVGAWVGYREKEYGVVDCFYLRLYKDGSATFLPFWYELPDTEVDTNFSPAVWSLKDDGVHLVRLNIATGEDLDTQFVLTDDHCLAMKLATCYIVFTKLPDVRKLSEINIVGAWNDKD